MWNSTTLAIHHSQVATHSISSYSSEPGSPPAGSATTTDSVGLLSQVKNEGPSVSRGWEGWHTRYVANRLVTFPSNHENYCAVVLDAICVKGQNPACHWPWNCASPDTVAWQRCPHPSWRIVGLGLVMLLPNWTVYPWTIWPCLRYISYTYACTCTCVWLCDMLSGSVHCIEWVLASSSDSAYSVLKHCFVFLVPLNYCVVLKKNKEPMYWAFPQQWECKYTRSWH